MQRQKNTQCYFERPGMIIIWLFILLFPFDNIFAGEMLDLRGATVVVAAHPASRVEGTAERVLVEEVEKRTGLQWRISTSWPDAGPVIALSTIASSPGWKQRPRGQQEILSTHAEAYWLKEALAASGQPVVWITGADGRGVLFGVGRFLRMLEWGKGRAALPKGIDIVTAPKYSIRGHQLGYRSTANSYDAWDTEQYEQYIRALTFFGANCIENIPFQAQASPLMPVPRERMNVILSEICDRYDLDYWVWTPAVFSLKDEEKRAAELKKHAAFYKACPRLNAVFFPGGDPGNNHPRLVMPFLAELGELLMAQHPAARVWISLQGFDAEEIDYFYEYVNQNMPDWLGGLVAGPSSPPIPESRRRLPGKYQLRHYPDITHTVRCQYPVPWWDQAFALTLGREPINPQPHFYAKIHNQFAPFTDGFIAYSEGVNDDVNKIVWLLRGWNPDMPVRDILLEYSRVFFGPEVAEAAADGILALERNWVGPLVENGAVEATLSHWRLLEKQTELAAANWRWQQMLLRATYDAYTRRRLIYEQRLERMANELLAKAPAFGAERAMAEALAVVNKAETKPVSIELRQQIDVLCDALFRSIGLQTSVKRYGASGAERGCILDYADYPLNNRWWLTDEFAKIRKMKSDEQKLARLDIIRKWEQPGPGSFYDNIGNIAQTPHLDSSTETAPDFAWWDGGYSRMRLSSQVYMEWPELLYENLDTKGRYIIRVAGYGEALLKIDGVRIKPSLYNKEAEAFKTFPVPPDLVKDGRLEITWDKADEEHLNWRYRSRISDVWLLKR